MPLLDVTDAFDDLTEAIQIERYGAGSRVKGVWVETTPTIIDATAVVQPASNKDINSLRIEGDETLSYKKFHTKTKVLTSSTSDQTSSDIIIYKGGRYKVLTVSDYVEIGGYNKAITEKLEGN